VVAAAAAFVAFVFAVEHHEYHLDGRGPGYMTAIVLHSPYSSLEGSLRGFADGIENMMDILRSLGAEVVALIDIPCFFQKT